MRSKVTPKKVGVGLKQRREVENMDVGLEISLMEIHREKRVALYLIVLRGRRQFSDQRSSRIRTSCVAHVAASTNV